MNVNYISLSSGRDTKLKRTWQRRMALLLFFVMFSFISANAQVGLTATGGTPTGSFTTLKGAFDAINAGTHTGTITISITGNTTETATAVLNASGSGSASYTSIAIAPSGGAARTISGAITAGSPLIDLNGADNVTIDGLNSGGDSLTISNTTASATSGTSTIRFIGGATSNTITRCSVFGSFSAAVGTNGGNIFFSTDANTANGNDNNTISFCDIGPAGANLPTKGIYMNGSTTTTAINNSGNTFNGNNIFNYFGAAVSSAGIYIAGGSTDNNITNNKFYQTATRTQTTGAQHSAIWITNSSSGNNFQVTGNTIGYASSSATGTYTFAGVSSSSLFIPIFVSVGTTTATNVSSNTITALAMSGAVSGTGSSGIFRGIYVSAGLTTVNSNTIGSQSATGAITFTSSSTSASDLMGIYNYGSSAWVTNNNTIGGITAANSSTGAVSIYGLRANTSSGVTWTATGNTIGGTVANSISVTSTATGCIVSGINNVSPAATFTGNTIRNLSTAGGTGTTTSAGVSGIMNSATSANHTIGSNTIYNLASTATGAATVNGIYFASSTGTNVVEKNLVYDLNAASATSSLNGIYMSAGTSTFRNNMIRLGVAGNSATVGLAINGINEQGGTDNMYHNSIYIGGAPTAGASNSFAFQSIVTTNTRAYQNNIFVNKRSNSGSTGKHYAIRVGGTAANPAGLTSNGNILFANGTGGFTGLFNAVDQSTIANWRTATGQDALSYSEDTPFVGATASTPDLHIDSATATFAEGFGVSVASVTDDYDGQTRSGLTPVDIGADALNGTGPSAVVINSVAASPSGTGLCTAVSRTVTANTTAGGSPITSVTLNYALNGVAQTPITMTGGSTTGTSDWTATIPVASPTNAAVTWSVTAVDPIVTRNTTGTGYQDEPLFGSTASATVTPSIVCNGSTVTLNGFATSPGSRTLGAGGTTSTTTAATFFPGGWGGAKTQYIIKASELTAAGLAAGAMTSLAFEVVAVGQTYQGFTVQIGHTTATAMTTTFLSSSMTQVYKGTLTDDGYLPTVGVNTLAFGTGAGSSSSFTWNGTDNIVVSICWSRVPAAATSTATSMKVDSVGFTSSAYDQTDSVTPAVECATATGDGTGTSRPKFTFAGQVAAPITSYSWVDNTTSTVVGTTNPLTVTPTVGTTYTVTMTTAGGCSTSATTSAVTVQALPSAPTATNGNRCGTGVVTNATVASTTGQPTPTFKWYAAATGGTALQTSTSTSYTTSISATTTLYVSELVGTCESSPRTPITLTIDAPPSLSVAVTTGNQVNCGIGTSYNVVLTATTSDPSMTYAWTTTSGTAVINSGASTAVLDVNVTESSDFILTGTPSDPSCNPIVVTFPVSVYPLPNATVTTTATGVCPGTSATINSGLSAGNFTSSSITYAPKTAPGTAVTLVNNSTINVTPDLSYDSAGDLDDSGWSNIPVGFNFNFFGTSYSTVSISTNGTVFMGTASSASIADFTFTTLPSTSEPFNMVAVLAMDNNLAASGPDGSTAGTPGGAIKYWTEGTAPNRRFVVSYENVREYGDIKLSTAQAIFYETLGVVEVHVTSSTNQDRNKLVGINNGNGTIGVLAYASGTTASATNPISTPFAYRFSPPANYTITWSSVGPGNVLTPIQTGTNIFSLAVTPSVTTTYDLRYTNQTTGCSNIADSDRVTMTIIDNVAPATTALASASTICLNGTSVLTLNGAVNSIGNTDGLTYQWQVNTGSGYTNYTGTGATTASITVSPTVASSYQCLVSVCGGSSVASSPVSVGFTNNVDTTTPATRCGTGTVTLAATTSSVGAVLNWYAAATGGTALGTGATFTTPSISATTTYYVAAETTGPACSSPRVAVTATVTPAPAFNLTAGSGNITSATICSGDTTATITDADAGANYDTFVISPTTGVATSNLSGVFSASFNPTATTVYTITASGFGCITSTTFTVNVNTANVTPAVNNSTICRGASVNLSATSTGLAAGPTGLVATSCTADSTGGGGTPAVTLVSFGSINHSPSGISPYYSLNAPGAGTTTTVTAGQTYPLTVNSGSTSIAAVWIDYNRDGVFQTTEFNQLWTSASTGTINVTIPSNAVAGDVAMRIRTRSTGSSNGSGDACSTFFSGTTEDYTISIIGVADATSSYTYSWTSSPAGFTASGATATATPTVTTNYYVTATAPNGCSTTQAIPVTVNFDVVDNITGGQNTYCLGGASQDYTFISAQTGTQFSSSNASVATIDIDTGVLTLVGPGTTTIRAFINNTTTGCVTYADLDRTVTVYAPVSITTQPVPQSILDGGSTTFSVVAGGSLATTGTYQWQVSPNGINTWTDLSDTGFYTGTTTATLAITAADGSLDGQYFRCVVAGIAPCAATTNSNAAKLTVSTVAFLTHPTLSSPVCGSGTRTFTVTTDPSTASITWYYSPDGIEPPVLLDGSDVDGMTFPSGVTGNSLEVGNITSANDGYYIYALADDTVPSNPAIIIAKDAPVVATTGPSAVQNATVCANTAGTSTFTVSATASTAMTYQWQYSSNGADWDNVAVGLPTGAITYNGATTATLTVGTSSSLVAGPHYYRCRVTNTVGCYADSNSAELIINTPTLSVSASSNLICNPGGSAVTLTASGTGATYAWSPATGLSSTTGASVTASPTVTTTYTVLATETGGCTRSAQVTVTVAPALAPTASATPSTVCSGANAQLAATSGLSGEGTPSSYCTPTVGSTGDTGDFINNVTFAEINNGSGDSLTDYEDFTSLTANVTAGVATPISITPDPGFGQQFRVWIDMNQNGVFESTESVFATTSSTTSTATGSITIPTTAYNGVTRMRVADRYSTAITSTEACGHTGFGEFEDYSVNISGATTKPTYTYSWSPTTFLSDPNIANPVATGVTATTTYTVTITSSTGCSATKDVTVTVAAGIVVTTPPADASFCQGTTATLSVVATGAGLTYQWRKGGVDVSGATGATLTINSATVADSGSYDVVINSVCADPTVTTTPVTLTINPTPTVTAPAAFPATCAGSTTSAIVLNGTPSGVTFDITGGSAIGLADQTGVTSIPSFTAVTGNATLVITPKANGCTGTAINYAVAINQTPSAVTVTPSSSDICSSDLPVLLTLSGGTVTNIQSVLGTGTTVNTTTGYPSPLSNYYGGAKHQMLVRASELTALGFAAGDQISAVQFNVNAVGTTFTGTLNNYTIAVGNTSNTVLNGTSFVSGLTTVRNAASVTVPTTGLPANLNIPFDTPFTWNGTSNIVIQTSYSNANTGTSSNYVQSRNSDPGFVSTNWYRVDGATAASVLAATTPNSSGNARPNMVFTRIPSGATTYTWTSTQPNSFTNAAGTTFSNTATGTSVYVRPGATATITATVALNGCSSSGSSVITVTPATTWYADADGDGFGNAAVSQMACSQPSGYVANNTDCDDTNAAIYQFATYYVDVDGDGYTNGTASVCSGTSAPAGYSATSAGTDCDDTNATITVGSTYYADADGDGYGNAAVSTTACTAPSGYVSNNTDCDDTNMSIYQLATFYVDADGDGWDNGTASVCSGTSAPAGYSATTSGTDCNDTNPLLTDNCGGGSVVNLTMFIQGYYLGGGLMNSVKMNQDFVSPDTDVEDMTIELHDATTYALVETTVATLHTDGTLSATFTTAAAGDYYIAVKGANVIQTWSAAPVTIGTTPASYDFTSAASQAYGDNMIEIDPGVFAMYSGELAADDFIDTTDYVVWESDYNNFAFGVFASDLNGDGFVDGTDYVIWEGNYNNFIFAFYPF
ncbi:MAG: GEVED domain-containing protein [Flavobacteriaceae bacterium]